MLTAEHLTLQENGWLPNNARLPVLIYRRAVGERGALAAEQFEELFQGHGWLAQWRDTIFDYHHYHSTAHEALGVFAGSATLVLGGPGGREVAVEAGDAIVLPAGTGHCCLRSSDDFQVVGAYPEGQQWDICRDAPSAEARQRIRELPVPAADPVLGDGGGWHSARA